MSGDPPPARPRQRRSLAGVVLASALILGLLTALLRFGPATDPGRSLIAAILSGQRIGDLGWLRVQGMDGDVWSDFGFDRLEIADRSGVWVSAHGVRVRWTPFELLDRRLRVNAVSIQSLTFIRQPRALPSEGAGGGSSHLAIRIDRINALVTLTKDFAWRRGDYLVDGAADLERRGVVSARVRAVSLNHPGDYLRADVTFGARVVEVETHAREASGGALAGVLGLDTDKPFQLDAQAHGAPRAGSFSLTASVGDATPAAARGQWSPAGGEASGRLDLTASRWLAPWRAGVGQAADFHLAATRLGPDRYAATVSAQGARLGFTASGEVDPDHRRTGPQGLNVDLTIADLGSLIHTPGLGAARATGRLIGTATAWRMTGAGALAKLEVGGYGLARMTGPYDMTVDSRGLLLKAQAQGGGGSGGGPLATLLGPSPKGAGEIDFLAGGQVLIRRLQVQGAALDVQGQGEQGLLGGLSFKGQAQIRRLSVAAPGATGEVTGDWRASQARADAPWDFTVHARGSGLRLEDQDITRFLGAAPGLDAAGRLDDTGLRLDSLTLQGSAGIVGATGTVAANGELKVKLDWSGRSAVVVGPVALGGPSKGEGTLGGTLDAPRLDLLADAATLDVADLDVVRLRQAHLALTAIGGGGGVTGHIDVTAASDHGAARAGAAFRQTSADIALTDVDIAVGGATLRGAGSLGGDGPASADLALAVGPGAFLGAGQLAGRIEIVGSDDGPKAHLSLTGTGLAFPGDPDVLDSVSLAAAGPLRRLTYQLDVKGTVGGQRGRLSGAGVLTQDKSGLTASLTGKGRWGAADFHTLEPAEAAFRTGGATAALHLGVGKDGRADVTLTQSGGGVSGKAALAGLDMNLFDPDVRGRVDGTMSFTRLGDAVVGNAQGRLSGLVPQDFDGASAVSGTVEATFGGGSVVVGARMSDPAGSRLSLDLHLPATLSANPLKLGIETRKPISGRFSADGAIGPVWDLIAGGGQSLTGHLVANGGIEGTLADPRLTGTAAFDGGAFEDAAQGLKMKDVTVRAAFHGDSVDVAQFSGTDGAKGQLSGSGRLSLLRQGASSFRLTLKGFRLIDNAQGAASASGAVDVDRAASGAVRLSGALTIDRAQISPTPPNPSGVVPMAVTEIHGAAELADAEAVAAATAERESPVALDLSLKAPGGVFIKGRGLNLELSLDAKVGGTTASPTLGGTARVVRGDYDFAGKRFQVDDSSVVHLGATPQTIRLDLTATRDDPNLTATIKIAGTAAAPTLTLSSNPVLPKDEILSQVLFGSSAAQLSGLEAAQLASALAGLAGGGGFDLVGGLRNFAHLDRLALDSAATTGFSVAGGKYVTDRLYVEFTDSAKTGQGAQVEWRLKRHVSIVSRVTSQGDHAVSVRWRRDY